MTVRGAPAIGVAAAMGLALAAKRSKHNDRKLLLLDIERAAGIIRATRPTARNLSWAIERMLKKQRIKEMTSEKLSWLKRSSWPMRMWKPIARWEPSAPS
jgi:methylthioribose-1-phosphate isomerase